MHTGLVKLCKVKLIVCWVKRKLPLELRVDYRRKIWTFLFKILRQSVSFRLNTMTSSQYFFSMSHWTDHCWVHITSRWATRLRQKVSVTTLCWQKKDKKPLKNPAMLCSFLWACHWSLNFTLLKCSAWHYRMREW